MWHKILLLYHYQIQLCPTLIISSRYYNIEMVHSCGHKCSNLQITDNKKLMKTGIYIHAFNKIFFYLDSGHMHLLLTIIMEVKETVVPCSHTNDQVIIMDLNFRNNIQQ